PKATFRTVIQANIDYLVISALWVLKVGSKFEAALKSSSVYAYKIRRHLLDEPNEAENAYGEVNWDSHSLYQSYQFQYGLWKQESIASTRSDLAIKRSILAVCLDIASFYDNIDAGFLLNPDFHTRCEIVLDNSERLFTEAMLTSFETWRTITEESSPLGIPIGLPASGLVANLALLELDDAFLLDLHPTYYGRYVDDIYLTVITDSKFAHSFDAMAWLSAHMPMLNYDSEAKTLSAKLSYSNTIIRFGSRKQRIFHLEGNSGLDFILPIEQRIRDQSSEHRLLPALPDTEAAMASKTLLVSQNPLSNSAVLRDADIMTLKRAGFADLLHDSEEYARHLESREWRDKRNEFYGLVIRHIATPQGLFDFNRYLPRIVSLMVKCGDWDDLSKLIKRLDEVKLLILETCSVDPEDLDLAFRNLSQRLDLAVLVAMPFQGEREHAQTVRSIIKIRELGSLLRGDVSVPHLLRKANKLQRSDWRWDPFYDDYVADYSTTPESDPELPRAVSRALYIRSLRRALSHVDRVRSLNSETWRAMVFPTRPIHVANLSKCLPLKDCGSRLYYYVLAVRGVRIPRSLLPQIKKTANGRVASVSVGAAASQPVMMGVSSFETSEICWKYAARGNPILTRKRFESLTDFFNSVLKSKTRPHILLLPELSIPRKIAGKLTYWLGRNNVSVVAGLEYKVVKDATDKRRNQALVSMSLGKGYGQVALLQLKGAAAWEEAVQLRQIAGATLDTLDDQYPELPVYILNGFAFGVLICSDLTSVKNRAWFQGKVDALLIPEWNQDLNSFSSLVESAALDVHAFVVQANNRKYGDSRIRAPFREPYMRDVVQVKGGVDDYFIVGQIDFDALREFQSDSSPSLDKTAKFKPFPIGFSISEQRRKRRP
ncbi:MAG: RNA-directed DNA polymerase, partial [Proteobacteria bacterium]